MGLEPATELQIRPGAVVDLVVGVDLRPGLLVLHVDVLRAEDPAERNRSAIREWCVVDLAAEVPIGARAHAMQIIHELQKGNEEMWRGYTMEVVRDGELLWRIPFEVSDPPS